MTEKLIATVLIASAFGAGAIAQDKINDVIQTTQGTRIRGVEVVEATSETIKYQRGEEVTELPTTRLVEITWSDRHGVRHLELDEVPVLMVRPTTNEQAGADDLKIPRYPMVFPYG